ncbi:hypothetical protein TGAMA5MH_03892 [Trichoderma gamsii]|uniref:Uncharacterized protein n=1 Tax=Trichoderma gamsii TaxID=398673 RepID=A0A2K0TFI5_9HYPO|nr:hypothetical protein TGAMA5MH_03892 [Trichoderma gamsii]
MLHGLIPHSSPTSQWNGRGSVAVAHHNDINGNNIARLYGPSSCPGAAAASTSVQPGLEGREERRRQGRLLLAPDSPKGYIALGDVAQSGWSAPKNTDVWCVRQDTVRQGSSSVWDEKKSGAKANVSVWEIRSSTVWAADGETETTDGQKVGDGGLAVTTYLGPIRGSQDYDAPDSSFAHVPLA